MAERYITDPHTQALVQGGLSLHQAALYECLVRRGALTASKASFLAGVPRTLAYKVLGELQNLGLVIKKDEKGSVSRFTAAHPLKLKEFADKKLEEAKGAKIALERAILKLEAEFHAISKTPKTRVLESISKLADELDTVPTVKLTQSLDKDGKVTIQIEYAMKKA